MVTTITASPEQACWWSWSRTRNCSTRRDLLDRCVWLTLPTIPEGDRRSEAELWRDFEATRPRLLGSLLDAVSGAMRNLPAMKLDKKPRMADFALWGAAAESPLGPPKGSFLAAYNGNREAANELAMEASAIGPAVLGLVERVGTWEGTAKELLAELSSERHSDMDTRRRYDRPRTPNKLAGDLRRLAP